MSDSRYFDEEAYDADANVRDMARRQFTLSLVVGVALLAVAGVMAVTASVEPPVAMTARHRIIRIEAPRIEVAQPNLPTARG